MKHQMKVIFRNIYNEDDLQLSHGLGWGGVGWGVSSQPTPPQTAIFPYLLKEEY